MTRLEVLDEEIAQRCAAVTQQRPDWPCRRGCDHCCRHLAEPPRLRVAEWRRVEAGLARLDAETRSEVDARLREVARQESGPVTCPFLDRDAGACLIYAERPISCRTYGFYAERGGGRYCGMVEELEDEIERDGVILGNHDRVEGRMEREFGAAVTLARWLET